MVDKKEQLNEDVSVLPSVKKPKVPLFVYQFLVLVFGVCLTIYAFISVHQHTQSLKIDGYDRVGMSAAQNIERHFSDLEQVVTNISLSLSAVNHSEKMTLVNDIKTSFSGADVFDQIVWVYQTPDDQWRFETLYQYSNNDGAEKTYGLNINREFLAYAIQKEFFKEQDMQVLTNLSFTVQGSGTHNASLNAVPFALMHPLKGKSAQNGVVIAVSSLNRVFSEEWIKRHDLIADLFIRDIETGHALFSMERPMKSYWRGKDKALAYEFRFGGKLWDVSTRFASLPQETFFELLPIFVLCLGFLTTALATLYMRDASGRKAEVLRAVEALQRKTIDLKTQQQEHERLNERLKKSQQDHRSVIDAVSDVIFETDIEGKILFLNERWRTITGFDPDQSKGLDLFSVIHTDEQQRLRDDFDLLANGQKQAFRLFTRLRTSDGSFRAIEIALSMIRHDRNQNIRVVGTFTDVEERRRAERALSEAEKKYRAIVENAAGGIFQITPEGLYLSANPAMARILGYKSPEAILRNVKNANEQIYTSSRERQMFLRELEKYGAINGYETRAVRKDGEVIWISENARAVRDESGNTLYYEGSIEDITERKTTDIQLREAKVHSDLANRAKSEFLANMSHELRTPLNAIIGFSEIIKNETFGKVEPSAYWEYAKDIHESGSKLLNVINEILDISRIEAGERQLNESIVDLNDLLLGCLDLVHVKIEANDMVITNDLGDTPEIVAEEVAIKQVVMNLLSNAIKFTPNGGRITLTSNIDHEGRLRLSITDTGIGLDEDEIEKALSPFGQLQSELSRSNSGTGLGLTLSDALVRLHDGELELFSQKGVGTTATIIFPKDRVRLKEREDRSEKPSDSSEHENI